MRERRLGRDCWTSHVAKQSWQGGERAQVLEGTATTSTGLQNLELSRERLKGKSGMGATAVNESKPRP